MLSFFNPLALLWFRTVQKTELQVSGGDAVKILFTHRTVLTKRVHENHLVGPDVASLYIPVRDPTAPGRGAPRMNHGAWGPREQGDSYGRDAPVAGPGAHRESGLPGSAAGLSWRGHQKANTWKPTELKTINLEIRDSFPWAVGFHIP